MRVLLFFLVQLLLMTQSDAQSAHRLLQTGDKSYQEKKYAEAQKYYDASAEKKPSFRADYNSGNSIYEQQDYKAAVEKYTRATQQRTTEANKARAFYNLGNSYFKSEALDKSVEAYKQALRLDPHDIDAKKNLTKALEKKQEQEKQKQDKQDKDQKNQDQNQDQQKDQNKKDQDKKDGKSDPKDGKDGNQNQPPPSNGQDESNQPQEAKKAPAHLSAQQQEELLRIINNEEMKVRRKMHPQEEGAPSGGKDW